MFEPLQNLQYIYTCQTGVCELNEFFQKKKIPYLRICVDFKVIIAQMTFHSELPNGCGVVVAYFLFLCIIPHAHSNVTVAATTPNIVGHFKSTKISKKMLFTFSTAELAST